MVRKRVDSLEASAAWSHPAFVRLSTRWAWGIVRLSSETCDTIGALIHMGNRVTMDVAWKLRMNFMNHALKPRLQGQGTGRWPARQGSSRSVVVRVVVWESVCF